MKRVLIDTNVVLDVLVEHKPHLTASAAIWGAVESGGAHAAGCEAIVTRDPKGFRAAGLPVLTPEAAAPLL